MLSLRRVVLGIAVLASLPGALLALSALVYILYEIVAESWYRNNFLDYGVKLVVLYALFLFGIVATGMLAASPVSYPGSRMRYAVIGTGVVGTIAALMLEVEFWTEADRFLPRGLFLGPFACWIVIAAILRMRRSTSTA